MKSRHDKILGLYVGAVLAFLMLPILVVIPSAFSDDVSLSFPPKGFSLRWFENAWNTPGFFDAFVLSAKLALVSGLLALAVGTLGAFALVRYRFRGRRLLEMLFMTPMVFPSIVFAVAISMVLGQVGLLRDFWGLVCAHVVIVVPYVVRTVGATLAEIDVSFEEAAATLGANRVRTFLLVTLPLLRPGLVAGAVFAAIMSFDEFTVSLFLVGPGMMTLPLEIYHYTEFSMDPTVAAISTLLIAFTTVVVVLVERFVGLRRQFRH
ncbi:ABC transporter permease [Orrella sp. JC864]|uniref:ABC transporter permease n=1 Tax=Orrella sp. JC864 TaxID=3120298 RepID=UPI0012BCD29E